MRSRPKKTRQRRAALALGLPLLALVLLTELRKAPEDRTWNGRVLGFIPYDFRRPTLDRVRDAFWAPDDPHLLRPRAFGIGWAPNLGHLVRLVRTRCSGT